MSQGIKSGGPGGGLFGIHLEGGWRLVVVPTGQVASRLFPQQEAEHAEMGLLAWT